MTETPAQIWHQFVGNQTVAQFLAETSPSQVGDAVWHFVDETLDANLLHSEADRLGMEEIRVKRAVYDGLLACIEAES